MGVQQSLLSAFQTATPATTRYLKVLIVDEQATLALTVPPKGTDREDFALIAEKGDISDSQASYFLWLLDGGKGWLFITYVRRPPGSLPALGSSLALAPPELAPFSASSRVRWPADRQHHDPFAPPHSQVPDGAKVREKMLYSSSKSRLLKALGEASFTDSLHATSPADLTPRGYKAHLDAAAAPHPLTERERALQEVKQAEFEASKEDAFRGTGGGVRGGAGPLSAVMGVGAGLEWGDGVEEALTELAQEGAGPGDKRKLVGLHIDPKATTRLSLASLASVALDDVKASLPADGPQYTVYSYLPPGDGARPVVIFIYSCPPKSPIRTRMIYSSSVGSLIAKIKERVGVEVDKKVRLRGAQPRASAT